VRRSFFEFLPKIGQERFNKTFFWCAPFGYLYFLSFQLLNEPGLDAGIDPGMALTPLSSSIGWD